MSAAPDDLEEAVCLIGRIRRRNAGLRTLVGKQNRLAVFQPQTLALTQVVQRRDLHIPIDLKFDQQEFGDALWIFAQVTPAGIHQRLVSVIAIFRWRQVGGRA